MFSTLCNAGSSLLSSSPPRRNLLLASYCYTLLLGSPLPWRLAPHCYANSNQHTSTTPDLQRWACCLKPTTFSSTKYGGCLSLMCWTTPSNVPKWRGLPFFTQSRVNRCGLRMLKSLHTNPATYKVSAWGLLTPAEPVSRDTTGGGLQSCP